MRCNLFIMQYLLKFKTLIGYFIELNWPRIILNWIYYWIELSKNNFELNIVLNWILVFFLIEYFVLNWILTIFFWIENWIESFSTVFFWIKNWIESFSSEIQSLIESSNCTSHGYPASPHQRVKHLPLLLQLVHLCLLLLQPGGRLHLPQPTPQRHHLAPKVVNLFWQLNLHREKKIK